MDQVWRIFIVKEFTKIIIIFFLNIGIVVKEVP
jgi:hypothetical protein